LYQGRSKHNEKYQNYVKLCQSRKQTKIIPRK
jgi:hypothetical protein